MKMILLIVLLPSFLACSNSSTLKTGLEGTKLPSFSMLLVDSITKFETNKLPDGKPVVLFYLSPNCPYCRAQTEAIIKNIKSLKDIQFCLITSESFSDFKNFYTEYHLEKYPNVTVGIDYANFFGNYFKAQSVPYIAIYDNNKKLKQVIIGLADLSEIKNITTN